MWLTVSLSFSLKGQVLSRCLKAFNYSWSSALSCRRGYTVAWLLLSEACHRVITWVSNGPKIGNVSAPRNIRDDMRAHTHTRLQKHSTVSPWQCRKGQSGPYHAALSYAVRASTVRLLHYLLIWSHSVYFLFYNHGFVSHLSFHLALYYCTVLQSYTHNTANQFLVSVKKILTTCKLKCKYNIHLYFC